jgi:glycosyltransferase involved in cell wall biosynthesis
MAGKPNRPSVPERLRQARRLLAAEGAAGVAHRLLSRATDSLASARPAEIPVRREDLVAASQMAAAGAAPPAPKPWRPGEPLEVALVCGPAGEGSGGHTTMFRMLAGLERRGHRCTVYIDDRHGWELAQHQRRIRAWWPWLGAEVRDLAAGIADSHVIFATSWETAYPVLTSPARGERCYFVQDFEPWFYPAGAAALCAEATYRFGFHGVTAGRWLAERLRRDYDMPAGHFDFGCDLEHYALEGGERAGGEPAGRADVCYFCRPSTPRRAHELAVVALETFAARHPETTIHTYGESAGELPFPVVDHGLMTPPELGRLYNRCAAGLVLSATNVSLVPHEMLAAGCIPVVNDAEHNRVVLDNDAVAYAEPTPFALAEALSRLVTRPPAEREADARAAAASVESTSWETSADQVERILLDLVGARSASPLTV